MAVWAVRIDDITTICDSEEQAKMFAEQHVSLGLPIVIWEQK